MGAQTAAGPLPERRKRERETKGERNRQTEKEIIENIWMDRYRGRGER